MVRSPNSTDCTPNPMELAYLQDDEDSGCATEMAMLAGELPKRGISVVSFLKNDLIDARLSLPSDCLVAGEMEVVLTAMKQMRIPVPRPNDYPKALTDLLHRRIWECTLSELRSRFREPWPEPVFAKPAAERKLFRGRIFREPWDLKALGDLSGETRVLCSEVLPIISEFRFYVIESAIVARENYDGDPRDTPDEEVVRNAIARLDESQESFSAYAIDFGLLRTRETVLIEMNDGFSVGTYCEIDPAVYTDFTLRRWKELLEEREDRTTRIV